MLKRISEQIAEDFINVVRGVMTGEEGVNDKVGRNTLENSDLLRQMKTVASADDDKIIVSLYINSYITFVESGRRAGAKYPPVAPILRWMKKHNISTDNGTLWKIMHSIVEQGISPRPIMKTAMDILERHYSDEWMDKVFEEIVKRLDETFK